MAESALKVQVLAHSMGDLAALERNGGMKTLNRLLLESPGVDPAVLRLETLGETSSV